MLARWPNCACEYRHCHTGCMLPQKQNKILKLDHASHEIQVISQTRTHSAFAGYYNETSDLLFCM